MTDAGDTVWVGLCCIPAANVAHMQAFTSEGPAEEYAERAERLAREGDFPPGSVYVQTAELDVKEEYSGGSD